MKMEVMINNWEEGKDKFKRMKKKEIV